MSAAIVIDSVEKRKKKETKALSIIPQRFSFEQTHTHRNVWRPGVPALNPGVMYRLLRIEHSG